MEPKKSQRFFFSLLTLVLVCFATSARAECEGVECCPEGVAPVFGTPSRDVMRGTFGADCLLGQAGNDYILTRAGEDAALGGPGNDILLGMSVDPDLLKGGSGDDLLIGGPGGDTLYGGDDNDRLYSRSGDDHVMGGGGDDMILTDSGDDYADGGPGRDVVTGYGGDDELRGGDDDDAVLGGKGNDILIGGRGADLVVGGTGDDIIRIDESCEGSVGDVVVGGPGYDEVHSPLKEEQLLELGFIFLSIEEFVETEVPPDPACQLDPPRAVGEGGLCSLFEEAAALLEGTVDDISYEFDEQEGPREVVTLADVEVHLGEIGLPMNVPLRLRTMRGPVPTIVNPEDESEVAFFGVDHTPIFHEGERYVLLLRGTFWNYSPVLWPHYFRIAEVADKDVVINEAGHPLTHVYGAELRIQVFEHLVFGEPINQLENPSAQEIAPALTPEEYVEGLQDIVENCSDAFAGKFSPFPDQRRQWDRVGVAPSGGGGIIPPCIPGAIDGVTGEEQACDE